MKQLPFLLAVFLFVTSCGARYIEVTKIDVEKEGRVSNFVGSPDPSSKDPMKGEKLYVSWRIPFAVDPQKCQIRLKMLYKDFTEEEVVQPLHSRIGVFSTPLIGNKYEERKGFYSYKATLETLDGSIMDTWKQVMWVDLEKY